MKHWDGRDRDDVVELDLPRRDRERLAVFFEAPANRRRTERPHIGSWIGLALAVAVLVGLAVLLTPSHPVSSKLMH